MNREHPEARFGPPGLPITGALLLGEVIAVDDPDGRNRVRIKLLSYDGPDSQDAPIWARVAVPFAGNDRGAFFIPGVGDEVLVGFVNGDPRLPVVVGAMWNGANAAPESLPGNAVDRWSLTGTHGTRIAIVEESAASAKVEFSTPGGVKGTLTDEGGGRIKFEAAGSTMTMEPAGVTIETPGSATIKASRVSIEAGIVQVNAGMSTFSGVVQCDVLLTNTVVATTYTPGAGNIW